MDAHIVDIVSCPPLICVSDLENLKNINFHGAAEISKLTWCNLFGHRNNQSAISGQTNQNAPGQPKVDLESKLVKIIPK